MMTPTMLKFLLPDCILDLSHHLQWVTDIEKSFCSTVATSLSQVQTINSRGVFKVGYVEGLEKHQQTLTLDAVVQLVIKPETKNRYSQVIQPVMMFTFEQLNDLHSLLMVLQGQDKSKTDMDRFVEILDGVTRLGKLYIRLCSAGSIIFKKWRATFYCEPGVRVCADIDFGLSDQFLHAPCNVNITKQIMELCEFLEGCLDQWTEHISSKRQEFEELSHFTVEQLVFLRSELALVCKGALVDAGLCTLLDSVKSGCSKEDIRTALLVVFKKLDHKMENTDPRKSGIINNLEFIQELVDAGYDRRLAIEAQKYVDTTDTQEGILWCMEHEDLELEELEESQLDPGHLTDLDLSAGLSQCTILDVTKTMLEDTSQQESSLMEKLQNMWNHHLEVSCESNFSDILSLEHLGLILHELSKQCI